MTRREYNARHRALGLCVYCTQPTCATSRSVCEDHKLKRYQCTKKWLTPEYRRAYQRLSRQRNPQKNNARQAVYRAIASGKIVRPDICSMCKVPCYPQAHHDDYAQPLVVVWLCRDCHDLKHWGRK